MDDQILRSRSVVHDFAATTLASIPNMFGRLVYIASLRDLSSGNYEHAGLAALYSPDAVQEALECCHLEIFQRILETPLSVQAQDLSACLQGMGESYELTLSNWQQMEAYRVLLPGNTPDYLKELFFSNLRALLEILQAEHSTVRSTA
jgi:hypothetical protein